MRPYAEVMRIEKSSGQTPTERYLARLCDATFLGLWSYANPFKADGKELCDLIAIFENHIFLFFDRESRKFDRSGADVGLTWERWKKEAIARQIQTASGAKRYVLNNRDKIFLDASHSACPLVSHKLIGVVVFIFNRIEQLRWRLLGVVR
jgi:hypothetical protein